MESFTFLLRSFTFSLFLFYLTQVEGLDVKEYLSKYGYQKNHGYASTEEENLQMSIAEFQAVNHLNVSGYMDDDTMNLMMAPRCGVADFGYSKWAEDFDGKWEKYNLNYYFNNYTPDLGKSTTTALTKKAFKFWSDVTPLTFKEQRDFGDILIHFGRRRHHDGRKKCEGVFDGRGGELAHAFPPPDGRLHFDEDEYFAAEGQRGVSYLWTATHELGHALGLKHDMKNKDAVMYPYYRKDPKGMKLAPSDIKRIQTLYGKHGEKPPCEDTIVNCGSLKQYCKDDSGSWKDLLLRKCRKTCGFCS